MLSNSELEAQAEESISTSKYEEAIRIYQEIQPESDRILHKIGIIYAEKIGDYDLAISCFERAIQIQEKVFAKKFIENSKFDCWIFA